MLKVMNAEKKMNMNVISAKDMSESYPMLESYRAIAFMQGDALLAGEMAKAKKPEEWATDTPRNPTNSMVVQYVGGIRISKKKSWMTRSSRFSSGAKSTPSTINGLLSPSQLWIFANACSSPQAKSARRRNTCRKRAPC
jgi:hypothetical protein